MPSTCSDGSHLPKSHHECIDIIKTCTSVLKGFFDCLLQFCSVHSTYPKSSSYNSTLLLTELINKNNSRSVSGNPLFSTILAFVAVNFWQKAATLHMKRVYRLNVKKAPFASCQAFEGFLCIFPYCQQFLRSPCVIVNVFISSRTCRPVRQRRLLRQQLRRHFSFLPL